MLDTLTASRRHLALLMLGAVISALATNLGLLGLPAGWESAVGALLAWLVAWGTPLIKQYGVGSGTVIPGEVVVSRGEVDPVEDFDPNAYAGDAPEDH